MKTPYPLVRRAASIVAGIVLVLHVATPAAANTIYSYTGDYFSGFGDETPPAGTFDATMRVTATIELSKPFLPNLAQTDYTGLVLDFTISDGRRTITKATADSFEVVVATNATGGFDYMKFSAIQGVMNAIGDQQHKIQTLTLPGFPLAEEDFGALSECIQLAVHPGGTSCVALTDVGSVEEAGTWKLGAPSNGGTSPGDGGDNAGTSAVPEPGTSVLVLAGALVGLVARRRLR